MEQNQSVLKKPNPKVLSANSTITFGKKHNGKLVEQVIKEDPHWIIWAQDNVDYIVFTPEVLARCHDSEAVSKPSFRFNTIELIVHIGELEMLEQGTDSYGTPRVIHGVPVDANIHGTYTYFKKMAEYLLDRLTDEEFITINRE